MRTHSLLIYFKKKGFFGILRELVGSVVNHFTLLRIYVKGINVRLILHKNCNFTKQQPYLRLRNLFLR